MSRHSQQNRQDDTQRELLPWNEGIDSTKLCTGRSLRVRHSHPIDIEAITAISRTSVSVGTKNLPVLISLLRTWYHRNLSSTKYPVEVPLLRGTHKTPSTSKSIHRYHRPASPPVSYRSANTEIRLSQKFRVPSTSSTAPVQPIAR